MPWQERFGWTRHWREVAAQASALDRPGLAALLALTTLLLWPGIACLLLVSSEDSPMASWPALLMGLAMALVLLLLTARPWLNLLLVLPLLLFQPVEWYAVHTYHSQVSPGMFAVFLLTNVEELSGYLADRWALALAGGALWLLLLAAAWWLLRRGPLHVPLRLRLTVLAPLLIAAAAAALWRGGGPDGLRTYATAAPFAGSAIRFGEMLAQRAQVERFAADRAGYRHGAVSTRRDERQLVILVIGESLRWGNLQVNGYARPTTPRLAAREGLISLADVASCGHLTTQALPPALTGCQPDDLARMNRCPSLVAACREAGFATWWLSNQAPTGRWDELVASYAREAAVVRWMNPAPLISEWGRVQAYDEKLLGATTEVLRELPDKALVVVHLMGSHARYELRYPPAMAAFQPATAPGAGESYAAHRAEMANAYDNSVLATDAVVDACIALHQRSGRAGFVMFVADHGESLFDDARGFQGHGNLPPPQVELRVPWLLWPSPAERAAHPDAWAAVAANRSRRVSTRDVFQTLLHLAGIAIREAEPARCLGSPDYREQPRLLIDSWGRTLDFDRDIAAAGR